VVHERRRPDYHGEDKAAISRRQCRDPLRVLGRRFRRNNQAILERLNSNGIDAMIISPFPVDAEYGRCLQSSLVQAIEAARKNSQAFSLAELFSTASEQTARQFKEEQKINFEDMDLEFLIAGDYRIRIAPK